MHVPRQVLNLKKPNTQNKKRIKRESVGKTDAIKEYYIKVLQNEDVFNNKINLAK